MIYKARARFREDLLGEFLRKLTDGTICNQKPDGMEILASMQRARVTDDGVVEWSEKCFCPTPLAHERETVYDRYLTDIETSEVEGYVDFEGEPFMEYMMRKAGAAGISGACEDPPRGTRTV